MFLLDSKGTTPKYWVSVPVYSPPPCGSSPFLPFCIHLPSVFPGTRHRPPEFRSELFRPSYSCFFPDNARSYPFASSSDTPLSPPNQTTPSPSSRAAFTRIISPRSVCSYLFVISIQSVALEDDFFRAHRPLAPTATLRHSPNKH